MINQWLKQTVLLVGMICSILFCGSWNIYADTYKDGMITVKHEEFPVKRDGSRMQFNHPSSLVGNVITNALSYVYYEEKGLLKKKGSLRVFQDDEIKKLTPLIIQAFSVATPDQVVAVSSFSERLLLTDQRNYCIMFMSGNSLNIVFSLIHMFQTYNDTMSEKKNFTMATMTTGNPAELKQSRFWELIPSAGQRLESKHENWLVIDLGYDAYQQPVAQRIGTVDEKIKVGTSDLDVRLKKLEEKMSSGSAPAVASNQPQNATPPQEARTESKIKNKLLILRELVKDGIISEEDYDYKKAKLLREAMDDMSLKDQLREIKDLKSEGLITEEDYNEKKKALLDQF
jgi:putative oligomerization/nucleic acid binding protein